MPSTTERLQKLQAMLQREPNDTFLLYAIAMEYKKLNDVPAALDYLGRVLQQDPSYCVAYHQTGLVYEMAGNLDAARKAYRDGIAAAAQKGDAHAKEEMEAALAMIE